MYIIWCIWRLMAWATRRAKKRELLNWWQRESWLRVRELVWKYSMYNVSSEQNSYIRASTMNRSTRPSSETGNPDPSSGLVEMRILPEFSLWERRAELYKAVRASHSEDVREAYMSYMSRELTGVSRARKYFKIISHWTRLCARQALDVYRRESEIERIVREHRSSWPALQ